MAKKRPPKLLTVNHDDYHAEYVGRTNKRLQFFLTTPFVPEVGSAPGREFIALYVFSESGQLESATIDDLGSRATMNEDARQSRRDELLESLGDKEFGAIRVAPFRLERFGVEFGLIEEPPEESGDDWCVTMKPGDYMCFWPPWNSGDYDT